MILARQQRSFSEGQSSNADVLKMMHAHTEQSKWNTIRSFFSSENCKELEDKFISGHTADLWFRFLCMMDYVCSQRMSDKLRKDLVVAKDILQRESFFKELFSKLFQALMKIENYRQWLADSDPKKLEEFFRALTEDLRRENPAGLRKFYLSFVSELSWHVPSLKNLADKDWLAIFLDACGAQADARLKEYPQIASWKASSSKAAAPLDNSERLDIVYDPSYVATPFFDLCGFSQLGLPITAEIGNFFEAVFRLGQSTSDIIIVREERNGVDDLTHFLVEREHKKLSEHDLDLAGIKKGKEMTVTSVEKLFPQFLSSQHPPTTIKGASYIGITLEVTDLHPPGKKQQIKLHHFPLDAKLMPFPMAQKKFLACLTSGKATGVCGSSRSLADYVIFQAYLFGQIAYQFLTPEMVIGELDKFRKICPTFVLHFSDCLSAVNSAIYFAKVQPQMNLAVSPVSSVNSSLGSSSFTGELPQSSPTRLSPYVSPTRSSHSHSLIRVFSPPSTKTMPEPEPALSSKNEMKHPDSEGVVTAGVGAKGLGVFDQSQTANNKQSTEKGRKKRKKKAGKTEGKGHEPPTADASPPPSLGRRVSTTHVT